jgi:hypothetical protein
MTAPVGPGSDSQGVHLRRSAEVIELCRAGQPVMGWAPRVALDAAGVAASFCVATWTEMAVRHRCAGDREG